MWWLQRSPAPGPGECFRFSCLSFLTCEVRAVTLPACPHLGGAPPSPQGCWRPREAAELGNVLPEAAVTYSSS